MKKLTKESIKFIDDYLIKSKVKYWDVRIELLDHIVLSVEEKMNTKNLSFESALLEVHRAFGNQLIKGSIPNNLLFEKGLYQDNRGFKKFTIKKQKEIARKYRKQYWRYFKKQITSTRLLLEFVAVILIVLSLTQISYKTGFIAVFGFILLPQIIKGFYIIKEGEVRKSLNLAMAANFGILFISSQYWIFLGFINFFENKEEVPYQYLIFAYCFVYPFARASLSMFLTVLDTYKKRYKRLKAV